MATDQTFEDMLNDYLPNELLKEELVKRDYILKTAEKDDGWKGGPLIVPFKAAGASSVAFGSLTAANDVAEDTYIRGSISAPKEVWGTMLFNHRDLMEHGSISEQNFLKLLPDTIDDFMDYLKNVVSTNLLNGAYFAKLTADGDSSGNITVDRPDRFVIGQKISVDDDNSTAQTAYVRTIAMDTGVITCYDARTGGSVVNLSGYTVAQNAKVYNDGQQSNGFTSIRESLLSSANGGGSTLYGQTKTAYPYLQAINVSGTDVTASNILEKIFRALVQIRQKGKGKPTDVIMSYTNFGYVLSVLEAGKGTFNVMPGSHKADTYGWTEIEIGSPTGAAVKLVAVQECDDDVIMFIDWRAIKFYSNGFFQKRKSPEGKSFFEQRATTGYSYLVDICCFGELVVQRPSYCGIMYSISIDATA